MFQERYCIQEKCVKHFKRILRNYLTNEQIIYFDCPCPIILFLFLLKSDKYRRLHKF